MASCPQAGPAPQGAGPPPAVRTGDHNNIINSLYMDPEECDRHNDHLAEKYALMEKNEVRWSETECEDAEIVITAYGTPARIALTALETLRAEGLKVGLFRPITLWPFPEEALRKLSKADHVKAFSGCGDEFHRPDDRRCPSVRGGQTSPSITWATPAA